MDPYRSPQRRNVGYSLIEILVVLVIVGVLAVAFGSYRQDKYSPAVRGAMNAIYGTLVDARTMARGSGKQIVFGATGSGSNVVLTYTTTITGPANWGATSQKAATGQYAFASDPSTARFCMVDLDGSSTAGSAAIASLKSQLQTLAVNGTTTFGSNAWALSIFNPANYTSTTASTTFWFNGNGTANTDGYVVVVPAVNGSAVSNGPVGVILVSASGNIYRYYRSNSSSTWVRQ